MRKYFLYIAIFVTVFSPLSALAVMKVSASPSSVTLNENGGSQVFTITLDEPLIAEVGEAYATINLTANDSRLVLSAPSMTFYAGDWFTPQTFTLSVINDSIYNTDNDALITMHTVSNSEYYSNYTNTITVTLVDNDPEHTSTSGSIRYSCRDPLAVNHESLGASKPSLCIYPAVTKQVHNTVVTENSGLDLYFGMRNDSVLKLQEFLIERGVGNEAKKLSENKATGYFGLLTKNALVEYQTKFGITPATGRFGPLTREHIKASTPNGLWW
jgi:hypothetical protein